MLEKPNTLLKAEIEKYIKVYPLISNQIGEEPDGNPVLYLGFAACLYTRFFEDKTWIKSLVDDTFVNCRKSYGIITRGSHKFNDTQEHDDYIGMAAASFFTGQCYAAIEIFRHGEMNNWCYDERVYVSAHPVIKKLENWYGRFPGLVAHFKLCAGERLNIFNKFSFIISMLFPAGESVIQMDWLRKEVYLRSKQRFWLGDKVCEWWENRILKRYKYGMGDVFHVYFDRGAAEPKHFLARWAQGII